VPELDRKKSQKDIKIEQIEEKIKHRTQLAKRLSRQPSKFPTESGHCLMIPHDNGYVYERKINSENCKHWYYIKSKSFRQYQFNTVQTCLFFNTLVSLPTGMGKTFIASNIMVNYYKWYCLPNKKTVKELKKTGRTGFGRGIDLG
jgi:hypothetical protein